VQEAGLYDPQVPSASAKHAVDRIRFSLLSNSIFPPRKELCHFALSQMHLLTWRLARVRVHVCACEEAQFSSRTTQGRGCFLRLSGATDVQRAESHREREKDRGRERRR
jgi:hypothetical protein